LLPAGSTAVWRMDEGTSKLGSGWMSSCVDMFLHCGPLFPYQSRSCVSVGCLIKEQ
jgi:hypothetical protein